MAAIHSKNTKPEIIVRKFLFANGFRFRVNNPRLPGHPDIVLRKYKTVIFVNGCFWHGHENCKAFKLPKTNTEFWRRKIDKNKVRDHRINLKLKNMGWHRIVIWECQLKPKEKCLQTLKSIAFTLNQIWLDDHKSVSPSYMERNIYSTLAAEDTQEYGKEHA